MICRKSRRVVYRVSFMLSVVHNEYVMDVVDGRLEAPAVPRQFRGLISGLGPFDRLGEFDGRPIHGDIFNEAGQNVGPILR